MALSILFTILQHLHANLNMFRFNSSRLQRGSIRDTLQFNAKRFDVKILPQDMQRVYQNLMSDHDQSEEYALQNIFATLTAIELHRTWNMTLLTSKTLQGMKDEFGLLMTWELGVFKLKFHFEDGAYELHRTVPYDFDCEYQGEDHKLN